MCNLQSLIACAIIYPVKDQSFGIIPIQIYLGEVQFLLVQHHAGHWAFPKGHAENGETDIQTAMRELHEETGISEVQLLDGICLTENYLFKRSTQTIAKTVRYFIGMVKQRDVRIQVAEIKAYKWVNFEKALGLITFVESRRIITEAHDYLELHKEIGD
jgi:bis(5'-nucleosidyl)-tetraphosphatase